MSKDDKRIGDMYSKMDDDVYNLESKDSEDLFKDMPPFNPKKTEEKKAENPLILGEFEIEDAIKKLLKIDENFIKKIIDASYGIDAIRGLKSIDELLKRLGEIIVPDKIKKIVMEVIRANFIKGWKEAEEDIGSAFIPDENAINFIADYTFENVKGMTEDIANKLRQELQRGIMEGEGPDELKRRVTEVFDVGENRAEMIARTEVMRARNTGKLLSYKRSNAKGKKKYIAKIDDRTSPLCKRLNNQEVNINDDFKDPEGTWDGQSPPSHINCRSTIVFIPD